MKITQNGVRPLILALCLALVLPSLSLAQPSLTARFRDEGGRYENAIGQFRGVFNNVRSKSVLTDADLNSLDNWIQSHKDTLQLAPSRVLAAGLKVAAFEQGVKEAAKGQDPKKFIADLQANPGQVLKIRGASEAGRAVDGAIRVSQDEVAQFKQLGERLQAFGKRSASLIWEDGQPTKGAFVRASFQRSSSSALALSPVAMRNAVEPAPVPMMQTGVLEAALIALAAAYLGIELSRLKSGEIKHCIDRVFNEYVSCRRSAHTTGQRALCLAAFYLQVDACVVFPF